MPFGIKMAADRPEVPETQQRTHDNRIDTKQNQPQQFNFSL
jgi:hypothetical protein